MVCVCVCVCVACVHACVCLSISLLQQLLDYCCACGPSEYESLLLKHTAGLANPGAVDVHMMVRVWRSAVSVGGSARS